MQRREFVISTLGAIIGASNLSPLSGQGRAITPDLGALADRNGLQLVNRSATRLVDGTRTGIRLNEAEGEGVAFIPGIQLASGTIEFDVRGKDLAQRSFVGVAFHGIDGKTHDAIYFRPFNFRATDPVSRGHAVQYHSLPGFGWQPLRTDHPGTYEQPVNPVPDPNGWFRARVVIANPKVSVHVADAKTPCLVVNLLGGRTSGLVGLWVGNNSGGDFANLSIVPAA